MTNGKKQMQAQRQVSAYEKQTVHEMFRLSLEWLEKYVEVAYPDYRIKKQIHDNNVKRQDANDPKKVENMFAGSLFGFKATIEIAGKPKSLYDEVKKEYYEWLGAVGIDVNDCPPRLKHFLFEINEILEGRGDKFERDITNRKSELDSNSPEYQKAVSDVLTYIQSPLEDARNGYDSLKGKTHKDIDFRNNFGDNSEPAEQAFKRMAGNHDYQDFHFFPQKNQQQLSGYLTENGDAIINGENHEPVQGEIEATPEQIDVANQKQQELAQTNSNDNVWMKVGIGGGFVALISAFGIKIFKPSLR